MRFAGRLTGRDLNAGAKNVINISAKLAKMPKTKRPRSVQVHVLASSMNVRVFDTIHGQMLSFSGK